MSSPLVRSAKRDEDPRDDPVARPPARCVRGQAITQRLLAEREIETRERERAAVLNAGRIAHLHGRRTM